MVLLTLLVTIGSKSEGNTQAIVPKSGPYIDIRDYNYILHHRMEIPKGDFTSPVTKQKYKIYADLRYYMPNLKDQDIDRLIILLWSDTKPGEYRNNSYDAHGLKTPMQPEYGGILRGLHNELTFFCTPDSVAIAKRDCGNEQDYKPYYVPYVAPYVPPTPAPTPTPIVKEEYKYMCSKKIIMGEERVEGSATLGRYAKYHDYYYDYELKLWFEFVGEPREEHWLDIQLGDWKEVICDKKTETPTVVVIPQPPPPAPTFVEEVEKPVRYHRNVQKKQRYFSVSFQPNYSREYYQQPRQRQRYQQPQRQRYTEQRPMSRQRYQQPRQRRQYQPQKPQWGDYRPFDTGNNPMDRPFDIGNQQVDRSFDIGNNLNNSSRDFSFDKGGYIDGVGERVW